jgi:hypothetical protein
MVGAFLFGAVVGWFLYFNNRYRKEVAFSDVAGLLAAIAGGAVVGFFGQGAGDARAASAYGAGVGFGFFGYLLVLMLLIRRSSDQFTLSYLIDGRRMNPAPGWGYGEGAQQPVRSLRPGPVDPAPAPAAGARLQGMPAFRPEAAATVAGTASLVQAIEAARGKVLDQFNASDDDNQRARLAQLELQLDAQLDRVAAAEIRADISSAAVQDAMAKLVAITGSINQEAGRMRDAAATIAAAAKVIGLITEALQALAVLA